MTTASTKSPSLGAPAFGVIVLLLFGFAFSEEMVTAVLEAFGRDDSAAPMIVIAVDAVILLAVAVLKRTIDRADGGPSRLWGWWGIGAVVILGCDVVLAVISSHPPMWVDQLVAVLLALAMGLGADFEPGTEDDQGKLDEKDPTICPACGHEFHK